MTTQAKKLKPGDIFKVSAGLAHCYCIVTNKDKVNHGVDAMRIPGGIDHHYSTGKQWMEVGYWCGFYDIYVELISPVEYRKAIWEAKKERAT